GPTGHQRGVDPVPRLRGPGLRPGDRPEGAGHRAPLRPPARRHHRPIGAGAVAGVVVRPVELDAAGLRRADHAGRALTPTPRTGAGPGRRLTASATVRILFSSWPGYGHLFPMVPLVRTAPGAGHEGLG